jgi:hypothetical protein
MKKSERGGEKEVEKKERVKKEKVRDVEEGKEGERGRQKRRRDRRERRERGRDNGHTDGKTNRATSFGVLCLCTFSSNKV